MSRTPMERITRVSGPQGRESLHHEAAHAGESKGQRLTTGPGSAASPFDLRKTTVPLGGFEPVTGLREESHKLFVGCGSGRGSNPAEPARYQR